MLPLNLLPCQLASYRTKIQEQTYGYTWTVKTYHSDSALAGPENGTTSVETLFSVNSGRSPLLGISQLAMHIRPRIAQVRHYKDKDV